MTVHNPTQARAAAYYDADAGNATYHDFESSNVAAYHDAEAGDAVAYYDFDIANDAAYCGAGNDADTAEIWLPTDARRMIGRWYELDCPLIELQPGVVISNLERWLHNNPPAPGVRLARVREYLYIDTYDVGAAA